MSSSLKGKIRPTLAVTGRPAYYRASNYVFLTLGVFVLSFVGWASEVQPAAAQDLGRIVGGVIGGGLRIPLYRERERERERERHRDSRRSRDKETESSRKDDKTPGGDGKTFGSRGEEDSKVQTTKVGDGGSPTGQSASPDDGRRSGDNDKGPPPSEKPQGEGPNFTAR